MTQPPDDRPRPPDEPEDEGAPENAPTVAWTPPDEPDSPGEGGPRPAEPEAETPAPTQPDEPGATGPIISATPTPPPTSGWQTPPVGTPAVPPSPAMPPAPQPGGGWEMPAAAPAMPQQEGFVIAGVGARIVGWLLDTLIAGGIPVAISLLFIDWQDIVRTALEQAQVDPTGRVPATYQIPITLDYILATTIGVGISFLYFVGFWTSRWRSTPGMIGLKMRVVDANTGGPLDLVQASKRWIALGWPLGLLSLVPVLQSVGGLVQLGLTILLFFSTVTNERRQGLHDKFAGSLVIRSVTSGDGATFVGCLVWGMLVILLGFVLFGAIFAAMLPELQEYIRNNPGVQ